MELIRRFSLIFVFGIMGTILAFGFWYSNTPEQQTAEYQRELLANKTMSILDNPNVTCQQIQELRTQSVQSYSWESDPFHYDYVKDHARDLWNAKNCGNHWGWFES